MALIKYDKEAMLQAMGAGLEHYIMQQLSEKLETKLNKIVEETYAELRKELPEKIKIESLAMLDPRTLGATTVEVVVDLRGCDYGKD